MGLEQTSEYLVGERTMGLTREGRVTSLPKEQEERI
jgi:hypothetical protein